MQDFLKNILGVTDLPENPKKSELIEMMKNEILVMGLSSVFSNCTVKQLKKYATDLGLEIESNAKTVLLRCILKMKNYTAEDKAKANANKKPRKPRAKVEPGEADEMDEYVDLPRCPPPKFDWSVSQTDSEDFDEPSEQSADEEMTDVPSENEEEQSEEKKSKSGSESEEDSGDGGEFQPSSSESDSDEMSIDDKPRKSYKKRSDKKGSKSKSKKSSGKGKDKGKSSGKGKDKGRSDRDKGKSDRDKKNDKDKNKERNDKEKNDKNKSGSESEGDN